MLIFAGLFLSVSQSSKHPLLMLTLYSCNYASLLNLYHIDKIIEYYFLSIGGPKLTEKYKGKLHVLHKGTWKPVCDDGFTEKEAQLVCHELGFPDSKNNARINKPSNMELTFEKVKCFIPSLAMISP